MRAHRGRRTSYDDAYGTCERTDVTLRIYPGEMNPELVTRRLGIEPTSTQEVGQVFRNRLGRDRTASINGWFLSSEGKISSLDLRRHLDWLLDRVMPAKEALLELQWCPGLGMDVLCVWWSAHGHGGPVLWPEQMARLAELNLECGFELSFYGDDD